MAGGRWEDLTESELERLLVERWLYRGGVLAVTFAFAVLITVLGTRGMEAAADRIMVGLLVFFVFVSAGVFVYLRQQDHRIYRLLRDRRRESGRSGNPS